MSCQMLVPPNTVPQALDAGCTANNVQKDEADVEAETVTNQTPVEKRLVLSVPHRLPYGQLNQTNSNSNLNSPGSLFADRHTFNSDETQTYRILPIMTGVLIPFLVLLSIPSLTSHWYEQTNRETMSVEARPNPLLLVVSMSLGMVCGVLANICLVLRFTERSVKKMTLLCIVFLSTHELINISVVFTFAVMSHFDDGFTYGQSFWLTICSIAVSTVTNITLIIDYSQTKDLTKCGSGLTHKQRSLVIIVIILLCYVTLGSLALTFMLKTTFIDALYFAVVSIETIGFGDIYPTSNEARIFVILYISGGILNLALAVAVAREMLLEAAAASFRERVKKLRAQQRNRHIQVRWRAAVKWRLQAKNLPLWVANDRVAELRHHHHSHWWTSAKQACSFWWRKLSLVSGDRPPSHKHLNLNVLTEAQLEAAALEAGAPLADLLPSQDETPVNDAENVDIQPQPPLTHMRIGGIVSLLGQFAIAFTHSQVDADIETATNDDNAEDSTGTKKPTRERLGVPFTRTLTMLDEESFLETLKAGEKTAFIARLSIACLSFIIFWAGGSAIFMKTEGWRFGTAVYFCFITFSTVGYGDYAPKTELGRTIFVLWSLLGVAAMTILISILTEAYSKSYKSAIKTEMNKARSSSSSTSEDEGSGTPFNTRQRFFDSRTAVNTGGTEQEFSPYSRVRNASFPSLLPPNDQGCVSQIPSSVPLTWKVEGLQSLLNGVEDNGPWWGSYQLGGGGLVYQPS